MQRSDARSEARVRVAAALQMLLVLAYPLVVYFAYARLATRGVALVLLILWAAALLLRAPGRLSDVWPLLRRYLPLAGVIAVGLATGRRSVLLLLPTFASLYLLWTFAASLRSGPPMIERFARLFEAELPDWKRPYCRKLTLLWCVFLALNALFTALLALAAPLEWWVVYTGGVFYVLLAALMLGEYAFRKLWFRDYGAGPLDRLLARTFPAERSANGRRTLAWARERVASEPPPLTSWRHPSSRRS